MLFLAEHTQQGRRWVMPMRLPEAQPADALRRWDGAMGEGREELRVAYELGSIAPPGIAERLMAACYGMGRCTQVVCTLTYESYDVYTAYDIYLQ